MKISPKAYGISIPKGGEIYKAISSGSIVFNASYNKVKLGTYFTLKDAVAAIWNYLENINRENLENELENANRKNLENERISQLNKKIIEESNKIKNGKNSTERNPKD